MLSRVADSLYWMSRYVERAENIARFVDVTYHLVLDQPAGLQPQWTPLINATGDEETFASRYDGADADSVTQFLVFDREYPSSVISSVTAARSNARSVSAAIPTAVWEALNTFYHVVNDEANGAQMKYAPSWFLSEIRRRSHLFHGTADATMSRDQGWHFMNVGRLIERADKTSRLLDVKYFTLLPSVTHIGSTLDDLVWADLLQSVSALENYRRRHLSISVERIVEFLILDQTFPRSVSYCCRGALESLEHIGRHCPARQSNPAADILRGLVNDLDSGSVRQIVDGGLHQFVDSLQSTLNAVGGALTETFLSTAPPPEDAENDQIAPSQTQHQTQSQN